MALAVTTKMKEIISQRDAGIVSAQHAVLDLLVETKRQIVAELATAPAGSFSGYRLQQSLAAIDAQITAWQTAAISRLDSSLSDMWELGQIMLPTAARTAGMNLGTYWLSSDILAAAKDYTFTKIRGVATDAMTRIRGELSLGTLGQKTPQQIAGELATVLPKKMPRSAFGHPIFKSVAERAEVITGLELGRTFSIATERSIEAAQQTVPQLQRMWIHAGHPSAARRVHLLMHGQVRKIGVPFFKSASGGVPVMYPRAPGAPVSEVIRCGCTHVPYHPAWADKETFIADWDTQQAKANAPKSA